MASIFLLIHGAWHGGWCWQTMVPLLEARGHTVLAPDLPGHGADPTPAPSVTLATYTDFVCDLLSRQPRPVILVGHSMGGIVITQAAEQCPERIESLVYLTAFLPRTGESLMSLASQDRESLVNPNSIEPREDGTLAFRPEFSREAFYANCSAEDAAFAQARLSVQPAAPLGTPVHTTAERWGQVPRDYIACNRDRAVTPWLQREMLAHLPCRRTFSLDTDHSPFLSAPGPLAEILLQIAGA